MDKTPFNEHKKSGARIRGTLRDLYLKHEGKVSDKWSLYLSTYDHLFTPYREQPVRLLEIGIQNGGSLEVWRKYFPNAEAIVGCNIDSKCAKLTYDDPQINVVVADANSDEGQHQILSYAQQFDLIIDDGSHRSSDIVRTFGRYFQYLKDGGLFVVEDLHCSYWRAYEGGLYHPFSSMAFFKRLADVLNYQHWGIPNKRKEILAALAHHYKIEFDETVLKHIHSIKFLNSMCVISKLAADQNVLGNRVISGRLELVSNGLASFGGTEPLLAEEDSNPWTATNVPIEEQFFKNQQIIEECNQQIASLSQAAVERDELVADLHRLVATKDKCIAELSDKVGAFQSSTSWRITKPLRYVGRQIGRIKRKTEGNPVSVEPSEEWSVSLFKQTFRRSLIRKGHVFYRRWLKGTRFGHLVGSEIIKRGLVSPAEIYTSALTQTNRAAELSQEHAEKSSAHTDLNVPGFYLSLPLNFVLSDVLATRPHINVLLPGLRMQHMSGGPNTALLIAAHLASSGESIRLIAVDSSTEGEEAALYSHMDGLLQRPVDRTRITVIDGFDRSKPIKIGANDLFLATAWWTAQIAKYAAQQTRYHEFIYLIQDFEPILHEGSTFQARALETYGLPHIPIINTRLLLDHLIKEGCGCYARSTFTDDALFFEPALDRCRYFVDTPKKPDTWAHKRRVLLFYARPTVAHRNLFELGVVALRRAVASGFLDKENWEIWGMGEKLDSIALGNGVFLNPLPWMSFDAYAERVRTADLLLSLMLSPHPSYPPLEMAASGNLVVTNSFSVKTAERLKALSPNILAAEPTADSITAVLKNAIGRINAGLASYDPSGAINLPSNWDESLGDIIPRLKKRIDTLRCTPVRNINSVSDGYPIDPKSNYEYFRKHRLTERRHDGEYYQEFGLLSFVTSVYNTASAYLEELAASIFLQDGGTDFEWLILDNGSSSTETSATLRAFAKHRCVRLERVEQNLGIIGGMRYCLERATGRYILPLDSDDIIEPDCVHVLTRFIHDAGFPSLLYTDEDKLADGQFVTPYFKPDWDPVLFVNSCYIAHLCAIDREKALALNLYTDRSAEGCHDWDSFIRFMNAGYVPRHVPEVLYSWRMHTQSTSGNIASKSYITDSHRSTLQRFLDHVNKPHIKLIYSPLFSYNVDWWFRRQRSDPVSCLSIFIGDELGTWSTDDDTRQNSAFLRSVESVNRLSEILERQDFELVHLRWTGVMPDDEEWLWEAIGLTELFPDTVMVGGALHDGKKILGGPMIFGFGGGYDCADRGRQLSDPGYFAAMWKPHSVSAISSAHCVVRYDFLKNALRELIQEQVPLNMLGPWLGALARETGKRIVFSPFMRAFVEAVPEDAARPESRAHFLSRFWHLLPDEKLLSPRLGLNTELAYVPATASERERHLGGLQHRALPYFEWLEMENRYRAERYPLPDKITVLTIITAVYEGSDISLLDVLAESIMKQTLRPAEWIIVANGPISENDLQHICNKAEALWGATLIVEPKSLGIVGAMRRGLELAQGQYIVPVDADDVLTLDAIQILAHEIHRLREPDLIYSDEDVLVEGRPATPYLRSAFDPVLNLDSSYIWHLLGLKREVALKLDVYADSAANWCQDWDSVMRVANAGGRIEHVAEVLYHWRQHSGSTTNKPDGDSRSLDSVRHVLEKQIVRTAHPERFSVEIWPVNRGAKELYIARRDIELPKFVWIGDLQSDWLSEGTNESTILVVATAGITIEESGVFNEVARLFELHSNVGAVGGCTTDMNGLIVEGCLVKTEAGGVEDPWAEHRTNDGGPYAMALKPQCVFSVGLSLGFFRIDALKLSGFPPPPADISSLPLWTFAACAKLNDMGWKIAYSPLVRALITKSATISRVPPRLHHNCGLTSSHALSRYRHSPYHF